MGGISLDRGSPFHPPVSLSSASIPTFVGVHAALEPANSRVSRHLCAHLCPHPAKLRPTALCMLLVWNGRSFSRRSTTICEARWPAVRLIAFKLSMINPFFQDLMRGFNRDFARFDPEIKSCALRINCKLLVAHGTMSLDCIPQGAVGWQPALQPAGLYHLQRLQ
ncbi:hypothetical protein K438DRAFT_2020795 [Mycena galopus ATCC 62051]|nr:hypothetical protein K438DRAFT_2020795 [Mycena galopus ATCC 62051]